MSLPHALPTDLNSLVALDALLSERSVTLAARRLGVTQSAMSHTLKRLRAALEDPLLVAGKRGLVPTARAAALAAPLGRALHDLGAAVRVGAPFDAATSTRRFVIATADYVELTAVSRVLARTWQTAPGIRLEVERPGPDLTARLESGAVDLALGLGLPESTSLRRSSLGQEGFVVLAREDHPRIGKRLSLDTYLTLPHLLIAPRGAPGGIVDEALAKRGLSRNVVLRVPQFASAPFVVASSDLVLTAPVGLAKWARAYLPLREIAPPLPLPRVRAYATWHERSHTDAGHAWFRRMVQRMVEEEARGPAA